MTISGGARDGAEAQTDTPACEAVPGTARRPRSPRPDRPTNPVAAWRQLRLAGLPSPAGRARAFTEQALADWSWSAATAGVDADVAGDIVLVVAELVANSVAHGGGALELVLDASAHRLRVEVSDRDTLLPAPRRSHDPTLPGGHGLFIVERVTDRWGVERHGWGKTVWAEVDVKRLAPGD
ncbi:ATP-binding protein [Streptomyces sp. NPDC012769]|uniref:ATP-binding protein n=1 Tax=Streptomyces sp. NPDC012769 TaxID=3364848 RepID=UPI0036927BE1